MAKTAIMVLERLVGATDCENCPFDCECDNMFVDNCIIVSAIMETVAYYKEHENMKKEVEIYVEKLAQAENNGND